MSFIDDEFNCVVICIILPPFILMIGYIIFAMFIGFDKGFPQDIWGWLFMVAILIAIPFGYVTSIILPIIYGAAGFAAQSIIDNNDIKNPFAILAVCLLFDLLASVFVYALYTYVINGGSTEEAEPILIRRDHF